MYIRNIFLLVFLIYFSKKTDAQFNTVKLPRNIPSLYSSPAEKEQNDKEEKIIYPERKETITMKDSLRLKLMSERLLLSLPLEKMIVNSPYGYRSDPFTGKRKFHAGVDFAAKADYLYAIMPGRVKKTGYSKSLGNYIVLLHGDYQVTYGHLHTIISTENQYVRAGDRVGITGSTGRSTGEHLHMELKHKGKTIDPLPVLLYIERYITEIRDKLANL